jgi:hypothetical protein
MYIFTAHIVQKHFLKVMRVLRGHESAFTVEAVRVFVKSMRAHVKVIRVLERQLECLYSP